VKVLHTSDWHIGAKWKSVDRASDLLERAVPDVVNLALAERVDVVLVTGDVFERQTTESLQQAAQTLGQPFRQLLDAHIDVVLLVGNHDSPSLFRLLRSAIELVGGSSQPRGQLKILNSPWVTTVRDLEIVSLPYLRPEQIDQVLQESAAQVANNVEMLHWQLGRKLDRIATELRSRLNPASPALLAYHGLVPGATLGVAEDAPEITYHQAYLLAPESLLFNDQVPQYNALGHIHKHQQLPGAVPTWYAGGIDRLNQGERDYTPSVVLINYPAKARRVEIETRQLSHPTPFVEEAISRETDLKAICDRLGEEGCRLALGRFTLTSAPADFHALDQAVRDSFPRLRNLKEAVVRPRQTMTWDGADISSTALSVLADPYQTIRTYVSDSIPLDERPGLLAALDRVKEELSHAN
jgi:exonuclease SbcD